jgi:hypothetical protein
MEYRGRIEIGRELSYTQALQLQQWLEDNGLKLTADGRAIEPNGKRTSLVESVAELVYKRLRDIPCIATGVLSAYDSNKKHHEIVVANRRVWLHQDGCVHRLPEK